jgi:hypothetical protein
MSVDPDEMKDIAAGGSAAQVQHIASSDVLTDGDVKYIHLVTNGGDPYIAVVPIGSSFILPQYISISYRTNTNTKGQLFIGSGNGWTGAGDVFGIEWITDGEWHHMLIDLTTVNISSIVDGKIGYARFDFFDCLANEGVYFDVEYFAFFESVEKANAYYEKTHAPAHEHSYEAVVTDTTCTENGYTTYTCHGCGDCYVSEEVPAIGHFFEDGKCTVCGEA